MVEMSGIEPESESIGLRISTSVVKCSVFVQGGTIDKAVTALSAGARKLLFHTVSGMASVALQLCDVRSNTGWRTGLEDEALL